MIRCLVVDDQALVRAGFRMILEAQPDLEVVGEAEDGAAAVTAVTETRPDVVLMDVRMPGMDGIEASRQISALSAGTRILVLTTFDLDAYVYEAVRAGASGFLLKDTAPPQLVAAVRAVASGDVLVSPSVTRRLLERFAARPRNDDPAVLAALTEREREVLREMARGYSNDEISARLHLGVTTVKTHVTRILTKLAVRDRVQAVVVAYETGFVTPGE